MLAQLATAYKHSRPVPPTQSELRAFRQWIALEYRALPVPVVVTSAEVTLCQVVSSYLATGKLIVSSANGSHPYLTKCENVALRAIHDWHHITGNCNDTLGGEITAYIVARSTAPQCIWWILFSEIVLQAAACIHYGEFLPQKFVKL